MKNRILSLVISLSLCTAAAISLPSCGDRNADSSSSSASDSSASSSSDATPESDSTSQSGTADSSNDTTIDSSGNVKVVWTSTADAQGDIELFTATFKVADGAASGLTEITAGGDVIVADAAFQNLPVECIAGGVDVGGSDAESSAPEGAAIVVETKGANAGDEVSVVVKLVNVDICTTIGFNLLFDAEVLEFVEIIPSEVLDSCGQLVYNVM